MKWLQMLIDAFVTAREAGYFARNRQIKSAKQVILR